MTTEFHYGFLCDMCRGVPEFTQHVTTCPVFCQNCGNGMDALIPRRNGRLSARLAGDFVYIQVENIK